jgi:hypothetical protein
MCLIAEIIHTCSHEKVAQAAVASMGADFAGKVGATAGAYGLSIGAFTARAVRDFERRVGEQEKQALRALMHHADQPILTGLQHILQPVIEIDDPAPDMQAPADWVASSPRRRARGKARRPSILRAIDWQSEWTPDFLECATVNVRAPAYS